MQAADDALEAIGVLTALRLSAPPRSPPPRDYARAIILHFAMLPRGADGSCPHAAAGRELAVGAVGRVLDDSRATLDTLRADPGSPGLESTYNCCQEELSSLAAIYSDESGSPLYGDEYRRLAARIGELLAAAAPVRSLWRARQVARGKPPARAPGARRALADDAEYYL